jgi:hypothetical protein
MQVVMAATAIANAYMTMPKRPTQMGVLQVGREPGGLVGTAAGPGWRSLACPSVPCQATAWQLDTPLDSCPTQVS